MTTAQKVRKMKREDVLEALITAFVENTSLREIATDGLLHEGYYNLQDALLAEEYFYHFGEQIEIV